jgi:acylphosphatase
MAEAGNRKSKTKRKKKATHRKTPASSAVKYKRMETLRAHVIVHGLVQGVWFRASTRDEAVRIGVGGWVRNLPDGTVEALFEGEKKKVEELVGWCHRGPSGAQVSKVDIIWESDRGEFKKFEIRYGW